MMEGREPEQARLSGALETTRTGRSTGVVLLGEAGIGKTALLRWASDTARRQGFLCLETVGLESGTPQPYEAIADLLLPLRDRLDELDATGTLRALFAGEDVATTPRLLAAALLQAVTELEAEAPLLITLDDAQWVDASSQQVISILARRVAEERIALLIASRTSPEWARAAGVAEVRLAGLAEVDGIRLLQRHAGLDPTDASDCWRATGGNPLAMLELGPRWSAGRLETHPYDLPERLSVVLDERLARLPSTDRHALLALALDHTTESRLLDTALADPADFRHRAKSAGLIEQREGRLDFTHPLLRTRVLATSGADDVRAAHATLAEAAERTGHEAARTWHLASSITGPDERVAALLSTTADGYRRRGAATEALAASELAARLSPDPLARAHRCVDAADMSWFTGDFERAEELLARAMALTEDTEVRGRSAVILGQMRTWTRGPMEAYRLLSSEADLAAPVSPATAATCLAHATFAALVAVRVDLALDASRSALEMAGDGDPGVQLGAQTARAMALLTAGRGPEADALMEPVESLGRALAESGMTEAEHLVQMAAIAHVYRGREGRARELLTGIIQRSRVAGAREATAFASGILAEVCLRAGRWVEGYGLVSDVLAEEWGREGDRAWSHAFLSRACAAIGREGQCRAEAATASIAAESLGLEVVRAWADASLGLLELGLGNPERALLHLERVAEIWDRGPVGEPGLLWWEGDHLEALVATGQQERARQRLGRLAVATEATGSPYGRVAAARGAAMLEEAERAGPAWDRAVDAAEALGSPFELARTLLGRSRALDQAGLPDADDERRRSVEMFEGLGARSWAELAGAAGPRRATAAPTAATPALDQLTPAELRVAMAVARGLTNKEVALDLCISTKTVDSHLQRIFRKLDVRTRTEMAARLLR